VRAPVKARLKAADLLPALVHLPAVPATANPLQAISLAPLKG